MRIMRLEELPIDIDLKISRVFCKDIKERIKIYKFFLIIFAILLILDINISIFLKLNPFYNSLTLLPVIGLMILECKYVFYLKDKYTQTMKNNKIDDYPEREQKTIEMLKEINKNVFYFNIIISLLTVIFIVLIGLSIFI